MKNRIIFTLEYNNLLAFSYETYYSIRYVES